MNALLLNQGGTDKRHDYCFVVVVVCLCGKKERERERESVNMTGLRRHVLAKAVTHFHSTGTAPSAPPDMRFTRPGRRS